MADAAVTSTSEYAFQIENNDAINSMCTAMLLTVMFLHFNCFRNMTLRHFLWKLLIWSVHRDTTLETLLKKFHQY